MKKKHLIGALIMVLLIVIAVPTGIKKSVNRLREDAAGSYYYDKTGYRIWSGIEERIATARNMITVAERYKDQIGVTTLIDEVEYQISLYEAAYSWEDDYFDQQAAANFGLGNAVQGLYDLLQLAPLSERDADYLSGFIAQMRSEQDKIARSSYNDDAREFNEKLRKFPVNALKGMLGLRELATFDEPLDTAPVIAQTEQAVQDERIVPTEDTVPDKH